MKLKTIGIISLISGLMVLGGGASRLRAEEGAVSGTVGSPEHFDPDTPGGKTVNTLPTPQPQSANEPALGQTDSPVNIPTAAPSSMEKENGDHGGY